MNDSKKRPKRELKKVGVVDDPKTSRRKKTKKSKKRYDQIIFRDWCKACGICSAFCPKGVIGHNKHGEPVIERPEDCIGCRFCELHCPDFAITIKETKTTTKE